MYLIRALMVSSLFVSLRFADQFHVFIIIVIVTAKTFPENLHTTQYYGARGITSVYNAEVMVPFEVFIFLFRLLGPK